MEKIKIKKIPFKLNGTIIEKNTKLEFKAKDKDDKDFFITDIKGKKVISLFPDINTRICDAQTKQIAQMANKYKDITFISISTDSVEIQKKWCAANGLENIIIISDKEYKDFAIKTNTLINKIKKLVRGFILLDENNIIQGISINKEVSSDPDYDVLNTWL
ncbi:MAG: redoxin domain-containing protein [Mycoplasma sp.]|nr:redoxin domain-containing protein [Mycoplasma sp.]